MALYVGTKFIEAHPSYKNGEEGYEVLYPNPNGETYVSWSPKDVFEDAYRTLTDYECDFISGKLMTATQDGQDCPCGPTPILHG
jgi:hypothetical protein